MNDRTPQQLADEIDSTRIDRAELEREQIREYRREISRLCQSRMRGEISAEQFFAGNLALHFQFGMRGYGIADYERDIAEHHEQMARAERRRKLDAAMRGEGGA